MASSPCRRRGRRPRRPARCGPTGDPGPGWSRRAPRLAFGGGTASRRGRRSARRRARRPCRRTRSAARGRGPPSIRRTIGSSALRIAVPSGGSASSSSPLACSTASSDPIRDRWTGWTAVTTPIDGRPIAARSAISPPTYMPISRTTASCSGPSRRSVSGSPISLFWLPSVLSVRPPAARTAATASFVEVLAMLPVTPTTSGSNRRASRRRPRRAPPGRRRHGRRSRRRAPRGPARGRVTSTAAAPRAIASARCTWPSVRSPGRATNS